MNTETITFQSLGLSQDLLDALNAKGFTHPTPIQAQSIPIMLSSDVDFLGQAQTGTGKTAAFGLPILELLERGATPTVKSLILAPTRELAIQIADELRTLRGKKELDIATIYGGQPFEPQFKALKKADIVVGTPGRVLDHIQKKTLKLQFIEFMVLDEADEMLNMGFKEDIESILQSTGDAKRVFLFSATMPPAILNIAKTYMKSYETVTIQKSTTVKSKTEQFYLEVNREDRFEALIRVIEAAEDFYGIVFCRTKVDVDEITRQLHARNYIADGLHGDISQAQRIKILEKFKNRQLNILVATDVASRGIDVQDLSHVINFAIPNDSETYVHRIGRTGRAGKNGTAITIIIPSEFRKISFIERTTKQSIQPMTIPSVDDIIDAKKRRFKKSLETATEHHQNPVISELTDELLETHDPKTILSAMLQHYFKDSMEKQHYRPIFAPSKKRSSSSPSSNNRGSREYSDSSSYSKGRRSYSQENVHHDPSSPVRLFIAKGKADGYHMHGLLDFIEKETRVPKRLIREVRVLDRFSFFTVSAQDSNSILKAFRNAGENNKPLVTIAKGKD